MADPRISNLERDGETRQFAAHGHAIVASAGGLSVLKGVFEPGWRWSTDIGPISGTASCQTRHLGYALAGHMRIKQDDGVEVDVVAGDLFDLPAGHDAWVVGDETCVMVDYSPDAIHYARHAANQTADPNLAIVRNGYAAFNSGDIESLVSLFARDVVQHVPGNSQVSGVYKGVDAVLGYYGKLGELTAGTFRADLIDTHGDGQGHVTAVHQISATRDGVTRVTRGSILFTLVDEKVTDLLELRADLSGDDAFFG